MSYLNQLAGKIIITVIGDSQVNQLFTRRFEIITVLLDNFFNRVCCNKFINTIGQLDKNVPGFYGQGFVVDVYPQ